MIPHFSGLSNDLLVTRQGAGQCRPKVRGRFACPGALNHFASDILFPYRSPSPRTHPDPTQRTRNGAETEPKRSRTEPKRSRNGPKSSFSRWDGRGFVGVGRVGGCKGKRKSLHFAVQEKCPECSSDFRRKFSWEPPNLRSGNGVGKQGYGNRPPIDDGKPIRKFSVDCPDASKTNE